jgi:flagellar basal body-associated protein FliL
MKKNFKWIIACVLWGIMMLGMVVCSSGTSSSQSASVPANTEAQKAEAAPKEKII